MPSLASATQSLHRFVDRRLGAVTVVAAVAVTSGYVVTWAARSDRVRQHVVRIGGNVSESASREVADAAPTASTISGAVITDDFPDPYVFVTANGYYAYSTNSHAVNVPVRYSHDLVHWTNLGDAAPTLPDWIVSGFSQTWAPSVSGIDGSYVIYLSVQDASVDRHCLVTGTSESPAGPFQIASAPLTCGASGAIDASPFTSADGVRWLTWKEEGTPSTIVSQPLSNDGLELVGTRSTLLAASQAWEHGTVEGPSMAVINDTYYLSYSGGNWTDATYATGVAVCRGPHGPCTDTSSPVIATELGRYGPGGLEIFTINGTSYGALHSWYAALGYPAGRRAAPNRKTLLHRRHDSLGELVMGSDE